MSGIYLEQRKCDRKSKPTADTLRKEINISKAKARQQQATEAPNRNVSVCLSVSLLLSLCACPFPNHGLWETSAGVDLKEA